MARPEVTAPLIALLESNPRRITATIQGLCDRDLIWKPAANSWSVHEVIAHLRACADVWGGSITKILQQDNPTFRYVSPRTWIKKTNYAEQDFSTSFQAFTGHREELLKVLRPLNQQAWLRRASVKATTMREETVLSYVERLAEHEAGHCGQIDRILQALRLEQHAQ